MSAAAGMAVGVIVAVSTMGVSVGVMVAVAVISMATDVQVGALVRVDKGLRVKVGVQVGGCRMMVAVGVGVW